MPSPQPDTCIASDVLQLDGRHELMLSLRKQGLTQTEIAQQLNCAQSTVSRVLDDYIDSRELAKRRAHNLALKVVTAAIEGSIVAAADGKPEAALEVADRLGVLEKRQQDSGKGHQVNIVIGMPGQAAGPDPIALSPLPFASLSSET